MMPGWRSMSGTVIEGRGTPRLFTDRGSAPTYRPRHYPGGRLAGADCLAATLKRFAPRAAVMAWLDGFG